MMSRIWGILTVVAIVAFLVAGLLGVVARILYASGSPAGELAVVGVVGLFLSVVFLIAGAGILYAAARMVWQQREPFLTQLLFVLTALFCGTCWTIIGVRGLLWPEFLHTALGRR